MKVLSFAQSSFSAVRHQRLGWKSACQTSPFKLATLLSFAQRACDKENEKSAKCSATEKPTQGQLKGQGRPARPPPAAWACSDDVL